MLTVHCVKPLGSHLDVHQQGTLHEEDGFQHIDATTLSKNYLTKELAQGSERAGSIPGRMSQTALLRKFFRSRSINPHLQ